MNMPCELAPLIVQNRPMRNCAGLISFLTATLLLVLTPETHAGEPATLPKPVPGQAPLYTGNRSPLALTPFLKLPIGAITPKGWLRHQLELERDGMTGHLEEISKWCRFEGNAWASPDGQGHSAWEELPYRLKGYGVLG